MNCVNENIARFLADEMSASELAVYEQHLESCDACRHELESTSGSDDDWRFARELLLDGSSAGGHDDAHSPSLSLSFLAPSDDPAMAGRVGPYEIAGVVGRGGAGIVLKGYDRALSRFVAVKVLDPALAGVGAARQRFFREARAMAAISHEHVAPVYEVSEHAGLPYLVMEYVPGGSLEKRLHASGPFDVLSIVRIGLQTAQALAAAHQQGLVHRDIKPGNILLDRGTERVRVADFGLARVANDVSFTKSGFIAGTPQYMAPEQVRGESCDAKSDLFSLGAVMYALCTGHAPFRAETVYGVMQRIVHDQPRSIAEQNPQIPDWLERFILRLLEKSPADRFASAEEAAGVLHEELAYLQGPRQGSPPERPWIRRRHEPSPGRRKFWIGGLSTAVMLSALAVAGLAGRFSWPGGALPDEGSQQGDPPPSSRGKRPPDAAAEDHSASEPGTKPASAIPSWDRDGAAETIFAAQNLEQQLRSEAPSLTPDPWLQEAATAAKAIAELNEEMAPPTPRRSTTAPSAR